MAYPQGPGEEIATGIPKQLIPGYGFIEKLAPYLDTIKQYLGLGGQRPGGGGTPPPPPNADEATRRAYYNSMAQQGQQAAPHIPPIGGGFSDMQLPGGMGQAQAQPAPAQRFGVLGTGNVSPLPLPPNFIPSNPSPLPLPLGENAGLPRQMTPLDQALEGMPIAPSATDKKRSKGPDYNMGSSKKGKK